MNLTDKILLFQKGELNWKEIWAEMDELSNQYCSRDFRDEALKSDFIDGLYERFLRMAKNFKFSGKPFEALLYKTVKCQVKSFKQKRAEESTYYIDNLDSLEAEQMVYENPEDCAENSLAKIPKASAKTINPQSLCFANLPLQTRRALIVAFRNPLSLDDQKLLLLSRYFKLPFDWLFCLREELKDLVEEKLDRIHRLHNSIASLQQKQMHQTGNTEYTKHRDLARLERLRKKLKSIHPYPRLRDMAECLGIPKGTISSSLFLLRNSDGQELKPSN